MGYYDLLLLHGFLKLSGQFLVLIFRGPQLFDLFVIPDQFCDELVDIHEKEGGIFYLRRRAPKVLPLGGINSFQPLHSDRPCLHPLPFAKS
jgi:hypothetical protein